MSERLYKAAKKYFDGYCQDEAATPYHCHLMQQHIDAKELQSAIEEFAAQPKREEGLLAALENLASVVKEGQRHVYLPVEIICASDAVERAREAASPASGEGK